MAATLIDGRAVAQDVRLQVARDVAAFTAETGGVPGLATVLVGDDPASAVYVANKRRACAEAGIADLHRHAPATATAAEVTALLEGLNADPACSGILLQRPLPDGLDDTALSALIAPDKDVDGLTPISAGRLMQGAPGLRPCTPVGVIELLDRHGVELAGAEAVVVGRSEPRRQAGGAAAAPAQRDGDDLPFAHARPGGRLPARRRAGRRRRRAAAGRRRLGQAGRRGDRRRHEPAAGGGLAATSTSTRCARSPRLMTPVPGGVGPMTIAMLLRNTVAAARLQAAR